MAYSDNVTVLVYYLPVPYWYLAELYGTVSMTDMTDCTPRCDAQMSYKCCKCYCVGWELMIQSDWLIPTVVELNIWENFIIFGLYFLHDIDFMTFVWLLLFYRTRDLCSTLKYSRKTLGRVVVVQTWTKSDLKLLRAKWKIQTSNTNGILLPSILSTVGYSFSKIIYTV